jgi:ADP-ribose pyrophosphatase YjhB (NUDIX family)
MHFIQKHILRLLSTNPTRRYSELKMPRVESNKFSYHLQKLITEGYVRKVLHGYALTTRGVHYCSRVKFHDHTIRIQPKVVTLIVCRNKDGEYLMYRRTKQPFLGTIGFPYGKIHLGEHAEEAVKRELQEKTGLSATLKQKGIIYLLVTDASGEVIEHMLCHIFAGTNPKGEIEPEKKFGIVSWMSKQEVLKDRLMPGVLDVLRIATSKKTGLQFEELSFIHE